MIKNKFQVVIILFNFSSLNICKTLKYIFFTIETKVNFKQKILSINLKNESDLLITFHLLVTTQYYYDLFFLFVLGHRLWLKLLRKSAYIYIYTE